MAVADGDLDGLREVSGVGPAMIGQAVDRLIALTRATRERGTLEVYVSVLRNLESHFGVSREKGGAILNDAPLSSVMMDDIQRWLYGPKETNGGNPWSPRRQDVARSLAGKLFRIEIVRSQERAEMTGGRQEIRRNPVEAVGRPRIRQTRVAFLSPVEWRRLIEAAEDRPVAAALGLWCLAGLRLMEAAHIRTDIDIALTGNMPHIEIQPRDGEYPWKAKTDRSNRRIPLIKGSELHRILERHVDLGYAGDRYFIRPANADRPYGPIGLRKIARKAFEAAGIKWGGQGDALTVHSLRHTFVSWLVQQDVQAMKIAKLIGDRPEQVYQTYGHLLPEDLNAVVSIIDRVAEGK
jgi:integrase